jgi:uncharacterized LabA/DUF88 family protein
LGDRPPSGGFVISGDGFLRTVVYVDGYNLYYGLLRRTKLKWLDLFALFRDHVLDSSAELVQVRYYTAPVLGRMCDSAESPQRQRRYLQALRNMYPERVAVVEGKILATTPYQRLVKPIDNASHVKLVQVYDFNEKKTDVNLAADLITGAWTGSYEQAVVCSNDTDLEAALAAVRNYHHDIRLGLVAPIPGHDHRRISTDLSKHAHWSKLLSPVHLQAAQLPDRIPHSTLRKPESW